MTVFATKKLRTQDTLKLQKDIDQLGMLGKEMGYEISTCQMQYDANNKEMDKKLHASFTLERTVLENVKRIKYLGVTITNDLRRNTRQQYLHQG